MNRDALVTLAIGKEVVTKQITVKNVSPKNFRSKIGKIIDQLFIQYHLDDGAKIVVLIDPKPEDELANPER